MNRTVKDTVDKAFNRMGLELDDTEIDSPVFKRTDDKKAETIGDVLLSKVTPDIEKLNFTPEVIENINRMYSLGVKYKVPDYAMLKRIVKKYTMKKYAGKEANLNWIDTSAVTSMRALFSNIAEFNGDISEWDTSNVTNMSHMFCGLIDDYYNTFNEFKGDISNWNVSNVKDMSYMFEGSTFAGDLSKWNVNRDCNIGRMFYMAETLEKPEYYFDFMSMPNKSEFFGCEPHTSIYYKECKTMRERVDSILQNLLNANKLSVKLILDMLDGLDGKHGINMYHLIRTNWSTPNLSQTFLIEYIQKHQEDNSFTSEDIEELMKVVFEDANGGKAKQLKHLIINVISNRTDENEDSNKRCLKLIQYLEKSRSNTDLRDKIAEELAGKEIKVSSELGDYILQHRALLQNILQDATLKF